MSLETDDLKQDAVLWEADAVDDDGERTIKAAVALKVRWEDSQGTIQDGQGDNVTFDATVFVDRVIPKESVLYLGTETEFDADTDRDLYRVVSNSSIPDIKARAFRRVVNLARLSGALPAFT